MNFNRFPVVPLCSPPQAVSKFVKAEGEEFLWATVFCRGCLRVNVDAAACECDIHMIQIFLIKG
jgi:hypothetical protein